MRSVDFNMRLDRQLVKPKLEIIIPFFNEVAALPPLWERLQKVFSPVNLEKHNIGEVSYLFIDDGSSDRGPDFVVSLIAKKNPVKLIRFSRNFGHQSGVIAGLDHFTGDLVSIIDCDLQDPPEVILEMLSKWREGFDVVHAQRTKRKETLFKRSSYFLFYRLFKFLSEVEIAVDSGDFCLMDKTVVKAIKSLGEVLKFPRGLRAWVGFRQTTHQYDRPERMYGSTKYSLRKLYKLATDGIASMSIRPLRLSQFLLASSALLGILFFSISLYKFLTYENKETLALWFHMAYCLITVSATMILASLYVLSAYVGRMYIEIKARPPYLVMEIVE